MKTNYTHLPDKAYEKPGEWGTNVYTTTSYEMPALNAIIETVMSIENQELVFAEGNNGNASAESVAVATMSNGKKKVVVVDGTTQVCTLDEDNNTVAGVTVSNYSGPLRTGDIDLTVDGTIDAAALTSLGVTIEASASYSVSEVVVGTDAVTKGSYLGLVTPDTAIDIDGTGLSADVVKLFNLTLGTEQAASDVQPTTMEFEAPNVDGIYQLTIGGEMWCQFFIERH